MSLNPDGSLCSDDTLGGACADLNTDAEGEEPKGYRFEGRTRITLENVINGETLSPITFEVVGSANVPPDAEAFFDGFMFGVMRGLATLAR